MSARHLKGNRDTENDNNDNRRGRRGNRINPGDLRSALTSKGSRTAAEQLEGFVPLKLATNSGVAVEASPEESLKEAAIRLQATQHFLPFAFGEVEHLYVEDVLFQHWVLGNGRHVAKVARSENQKVPSDFYVGFDQLRDIASRENPDDRRYYQRQSKEGREVNQQLENTKKAVIDVLMRAIETAGGAAAINKREAEDEAKMAVDDLCKQIESGELGSSLLQVIDHDQVGTFGFIVGGAPLVFQTGFIPWGSGNKRVMKFILKLVAAPMGIPEGLIMGSYCPVKEILWKEGHSSEQGRIIAELLRNQWDEAEVDQVAAAQAAAMAPATQPVAEVEAEEQAESA